MFSGNFTTTSNGQVIDSLDITGTLTINNDNVLVKNSRLRAGVYGSQHPFTVQDSEIGYANTDAGDIAVGYNNFTLTRVNLHGWHEGPRVANSTITDSWLHDFRFATGDHTDGVQRYAPGAVANDTIRHNVFDVGINANAAIWYADDWRGTLTLDNNLLSGGGYTLGLHESGTASVTNNVVVKGSYQFGPRNFNCTNFQLCSPGPNGVISPYTNNTLSDGTPL